MSLISSVAPGNSGREGGSFTPAGPPTNLGGNFTSVGAANTPGSNIGTPSVAFARNNRGSNIRIPYARLVPMRARMSTDGSVSGRTVNGKPAVLEYDGLEAGELAWILGRRLQGSITAGALGDAQADGSNVSNVRAAGFFQWNQAGQSAHALGLGHGVDRMQRLASTAWIETFFRQELNQRGTSLDQQVINRGGIDPLTIDLMSLRLAGPSNANTPADILEPGFSKAAVLDSDLAYYQAFLTHGTAMYAPDVAWMAARAFAPCGEDAVNSMMSCGLGGGLSGQLTDLAIRYANADLAIAMGYASQDAAAAALGYANAAAYIADVAAMDNIYPGRPRLLAAGNHTDVTVGHQMHGLFVMERGPFLRSKAVGNETCTFPIKPCTPNKKARMVDTARQIGSELAWSALHAELRRNNFFDWVPDGMVLSKFETGPNPQSDAEIDARMAQLFNVAIQGQAITKTWTGNPDMAVLPMDKVFVVLVADLTYTLDAGRARSEAQRGRDMELSKLMAQVQLLIKEGARAGNPQLDLALRALQRVGNPAGGGTSAYGDGDAVALANMANGRALPGGGGPPTGAFAAGAGTEVAPDGPADLIKQYLYAMQDLRAAPTATASVSDAEATRKAAHKRLKDLKTAYNFDDPILSTAFDHVAQAVRIGSNDVSQANLRNFRLQRVTSSYLAQYSHFDPKDDKSRCGMKISAWGMDGAPALNQCKDDLKAARELFEQESAAAELLGVLGGALDAAVAADAKYKRAQNRCIENLTQRTGRADGICGGIGEYILGGWCVGTVLDSAASRSTVGHSVRIAPSSMAINVNVNVEWWDADKLYKQYMDVDGTVQRRGGLPRYGRKQAKDMTRAAVGSSKKGSYAAGAKVIVTRDPTGRLTAAAGDAASDAARAPVLVDKHGYACPRPASRGPDDLAYYGNPTPGNGFTRVPIVPRTAY